MKFGHPRKALVVLPLVSLLLFACAPAATPTAAPAPAAKPTTAAAPAPTTAPAAKPTTAAAPAAAASPAAKEPLKPLSPPVTVKIGNIGSASDSGIFIAMEKGYFKEQGINLELVNIGSGTDMVPPLATGQIDVGGGGLSAGLFNAIQRGVPLKIVADKGSLPKGFGYESLMVRKELIDNGSIKDFADLKGRTVAMNTASSVDSVLLNAALAKGGLKLDDVRVTEVGFPDMVTALANGSIDAATLIEPFATRAVSQGSAVRWKTFDEIKPNQQLSTLMASPGFVKDHPEALKRFVLAYVKGLRDYNDAFAKNINKDAIIAILTKNTTIKDPELFKQMVPPGLNPDGRIAIDTVISAQDEWAARGLIEKKVDVSTVIDEQYTKFAVEQLGPYK